MKRSRLDDPSPGICRGTRGTVTGYGKHIDSCEKPCEPCRLAHNAYMRGHRKKWLSDPACREHDRRMRKARERAKSALAREYANEYRALVRREIGRLLEEAS